MVDLAIDAGWAAGVLLAMIRVAAFIVASPIYSRAVPFMGRVAMAVVLGYFLADPVAGELSVGAILTAAFVNAVVGGVLGFLTGVVFHLFSIAGSLIDFTSSLSSAQVFDPMANNQAAVFSRAFNITALTLFFVLRGDHLVVRGLAASIESIGLTGTVAIGGGAAQVGLYLLGRLMIASVELAMPALAALFLAEVVMGIASRFAPQANVFILGLPVKILAAFASVAAVVALMPETYLGMLTIIEDTFIDVVGGLDSQ